MRIIKDGGAAGVERKMFSAAKAADIHEMITWERSDAGARGLVTFTMLSDKSLEGSVTNLAEKVDDATTRVTYAMDWAFRADAADAHKPFPDGGAGMIKGAVNGLKKLCEAPMA